MTRYILDTNVISEAIKPRPSQRLLDWLGAQVDNDLYVSAMTIAEVERGILRMPAGRRRRDLEAWCAGREGPQQLFFGRILAFDERAATVWARLMSEGERVGRPRHALDMIIAATGEVAGCIVVTANAADFDGIEIVNPLQE